MSDWFRFSASLLLIIERGAFQSSLFAPDNDLFLTSCDSSGSSRDSAVLFYRFTADKEVDLMSTYVPETLRGQGLAADLSRVGSHTWNIGLVSHLLLFTLNLISPPQAALDFVLQENLKAHVSCWYIKKFIEEHPEERFEERVIG